VTNSNVEYEAQPYDANRNFSASEKDAVERSKLKTKILIEIILRWRDCRE